MPIIFDSICTHVLKGLYACCSPVTYVGRLKDCHFQLKARWLFVDVNYIAACSIFFAYQIGEWYQSKCSHLRRLCWACFV